MSLLLRRRALFVRLAKFLRLATGAPPVSCEACIEEPVEDYKVYGNSIQNGTPTPDTPIEVESVGEYDEATGKYKIPVVAQGKNLFDYSVLTSIGKLNTNCEYSATADGSLKWKRTADANAGGLTVSIPLKAGVYTFRVDIETTGYTLHNGNAMILRDGLRFSSGGVGLRAGQVVYLTLDADTTVRFYIYSLDNNDIAIGNECVWRVMINRGKEASSWEPYQEPVVTNIYLTEPLRKVGGDADYVDFANGKVVRNIKEVSTTSVSGIYRKLTDVVRFSVYLSRLNSKLGTQEMYSNYLKYAKGSWYDNNETIFKHNSDKNHYYISFSKERLDITDEDTDTEMVDKAKAFIKTLNNPKVYYATNTPTEELIDLPQLPTLKGTTVYTVDTTIQPSNMEISYYSEEAAEDVL